MTFFYFQPIKPSLFGSPPPSPIYFQLMTAFSFFYIFYSEISRWMKNNNCERQAGLITPLPPPMVPINKHLN